MDSVKLTRAWKVTDEEFAEIVYADTRNRARQIGSGRLDRDYVEVTARRAAEFDGYAPHGPTSRELFDEFGWWFECQTCCGTAAKDSGGSMDSGEATCATCIERAKEATPAALEQPQ